MSKIILIFLQSLFGNTATSQSTGLFGTQTSTSGFGAGFNTGFGTTTNTQAVSDTSSSLDLNASECPSLLL